MAKWLSCATHTHKVLCSNLDTTRHRMTPDKSLTAVCLGSLVGWRIDYVVDIQEMVLVTIVCG